MKDFIPFVAIDRRQSWVTNQDLLEESNGAALFVDISGFTALTQSLVKELGSKYGAEELLNIINPVYEQLIGVLHQYRGSVIGFVGDAITCWFEEQATLPSPTLRAVACGLAMQTAMKPLTTQLTPAGTIFTIRVKVAIAAGLAHRYVVGDPNIKSFDALAGSTLARMATSEKQAQAGEVAVSYEVVEQLGEQLSIDFWREKTAIVRHLTMQVFPTPWLELSTQVFQRNQVRQWLFSAVYERLQAERSYLGEFRPVTAMMIRFAGINFDNDPNAGQKLDTLIHWIQSIIHGFGGTLLQLTIGDKGAFIYAPFGAPNAHEDDPQRAVAAALSLQTHPPELNWLPPLQIGITQGEVWSGIYGASTRHTFGVIGQSVNLAARLMNQAQLGQCLVSEQIYAQTQTRFRFQTVGNLPYKGFLNPVPTYELLEEQAEQLTFFAGNMVGRKHRLHQLFSFANQCFTEQMGGVGIIYGEPGVGKSHFAYTLKKQLGDKAKWFAAQTDPISRDAFNPFVYFLKGYFGQTSTDSDTQNKAVFNERLQTLLTALDELPNTQQLKNELLRTQSFLAALLDLYEPNSLYEQLDAKGRYRNIITVVSTLLQAECRRQPVVLALEDGHWLDDASHELLTAIGQQAKNAPLLILITSRYADDGSSPAYLEQEIPKLIIELKVLTSVAVRELAHEILNMPISDALQALLIEKTEGNPFFIQQILYHLQEQGFLQVTESDGNPLVVLRSSDIELPRTLNMLLIARLDRLTLQVKNVVQTAAVLGREFESRLLVKMLEQELHEELETGEKAQIWTLLNALQYIFKHALLRDAAYEMQLRTRLRDLHYLAGRVGEQLYADQLSAYQGTLAYHFETAYILGQLEAQEPAITYLQEAGEQAYGKYDNDRAIQYFERALAIVPADKTQTTFDLYLAQERVYSVVGNRADQKKNIDKLAQLAHGLSMVEQAKVAYRQADYAFYVLNDSDEAIRWTKIALDRATKVNHTETIIKAYLMWSSAEQRRNNMAESLTKIEQGLAWARKAGERVKEADFLLHLGYASMMKEDVTKSTLYFEQSLAIYEAFAPKRSKYAFHGLAMVYAIQQRMYPQGLVYFEKGYALDCEIGDKNNQGLTLYNIGVMYYYMGNYAKAIESWNQGLTIHYEVDNLFHVGVTLHLLGLVALYQGNYVKAIAYCKEGVGVFDKINYDVRKRDCLNALGLIALFQSEPTLAEGYYVEALAIQQEANTPQDIVEDWAGLAKVSFMKNEWAVAKEYVARIVAYLEETPNLHGTGQYMSVFRLTWEVLVGLNQEAEAAHVLALAVAVMQKYLAENDDPVLQEMYLAQAHHRVLWSAWQEGVVYS